MVIMAVGMGLTMAPATESIMGSLPRAKAGVGSAMNDTTRQVGGAFGVAIIGSVMSSVYGSRVVDVFTQAGVTGAPADAAKEGLGQALAAAANPSVPSSVASELVSGAKEAFVYGMHRGVLVGAAAAFLGAFIAFRWLPARGPELRAAESPARTAAGRGARVRDRRMTASIEARKPGRPRSIEVDRAILFAALEEYGERGFDGMSVDAVADARRRQQGDDLPPLRVEARARDCRDVPRRRRAQAHPGHGLAHAATCTRSCTTSSS